MEKLDVQNCTVEAVDLTSSTDGVVKGKMIRIKQMQLPDINVRGK